MIRDLIKWVVPGLATVLAGTSLCLAMTSTQIAQDLTAQTQSVIVDGGYDWAELALDGRDLTIRGTTTDQAVLTSAAARLSGIPGIRTVQTDVTLAPLAAPYLFEAHIDQSGPSLAGAVPDEQTRQLLLSRAGLEQGALEFRSGMPDRQTWVVGAEYAIDQLQYLDQGQVSVSDLTVTLSGRAKSERAFRDLLMVMRAGAPAGLSLGNVSITPPLVTPYQWSASFDGTRISVTGFVPDDAVVERYHTADVGGTPIATGLALGSGEPADFDALSQRLIEQLSRLEYGTATITDGASTLTGAPATLDIAQAVVESLQPSGSIVVLDPPRIDDYWMSATRQPGGVVVFDGYAPDQATRDALALREGADTTYLKLGRGAPERYQSAVEFGLAALDQMSEGRFSLRGNGLTIAGTARSSTDYESLLATIAAGAPQGLVLETTEILAPPTTAFTWSATKSGTGAIALSGSVPDPSSAAILLSMAGQSSTQTMTYASGEPENFMASAQIALSLLEWLRDGQVTYDGQGWTVTGTALSVIDKAALETDFVTRQLASTGWSMAVAEPAVAAVAAAPYLWSATHATDGVTIMGNVPSEEVKASLMQQGGGAAIDNSQVQPGAPAGFDAAAVAGLDAVMALEEGEVSFDGTQWSLNGRATSEASRVDLLATLAAQIDSANWQLAVTAPEPTAVAAGPYVWSATRSVDGVVTLSGHVPNAAMQRFIAARAGEKTQDQTTIDPSAPDGFAQDVVTAIDLLSAVSQGEVRFDGNDWTVSGTLIDDGSSSIVDTALAAAATPAEDWSLALAKPAPAETAVAGQPEAVPVLDPDYAFSARKSADGAVVLSGQVPTDAALRSLGAIGNGDTAAVSIADGAPDTFVLRAESGLNALRQMAEGQLDFSQGAWSIKGIAPNADVQARVTTALADPAFTVSVDLPQPPPTPDVAPPVVASAPADIAACSAPVAEFSARNSILFQSGAAIIAAESDTALDELATDLAACPDAVVYIEGHTDADGDETLNMALSVARAEAVVAALVTRGVTPARLYAAGYGESTPIADNATSDGKRLNRRIVVTVRGEHF